MTDEASQPDEATDLRVEIDGDGVNPDTVDARSTLELASAYFDLLVRVARLRGAEVELKGLQVVSKCIALATVPTSLPEAREAAAEAQDYVAGREEPHGVVVAVRRVRDAVRALPLGHVAKVIIGPWQRQLPRDGDVPRVPPYASVMVRARPVRVGGTNPRVRFKSESEETEFSLEVTEEQARELGSLLYREVDIAATVWRDENDAIRGGRLEDVFAVADAHDDLRTVMRRWLKENAPQWDDIDDIEAELKRE